MSRSLTDPRCIPSARGAARRPLRSLNALTSLCVVLVHCVSAAPAGPVQPVSPAVPAATSTPADPASVSDREESGWRFASRLTTIVSYDDNIFIRPRDREGDFALRLAPGIAYGVGEFLGEFAPFAVLPQLFARLGDGQQLRRNFAYASYTPEAVVFARHSGQNAVNHTARLAGRRERELWSGEGRIEFRSVEDANVDLGRRLRQEYLTGAGSFEYALGAKTSGRLAVQGEHNAYADGLASTDGRISGLLAYQIAPKTQLGVGAAFGHLAVERGADQNYQQPLLQLRYQASEKLSFTGHAGQEFRQFEGAQGQRKQFVFSASGSYEPSDGTRLSLVSRRETHSSAQYAGENIVATSYLGSVRQRWWQRNFLTLQGGFVHQAYESNQAVAALDRRDHYYFGRISSLREVTERGSVELGYEYRANVSSASNFGFDENIVSLALSLLF